MKKIGVLGGMSWESSLVYYRLINEEIRRLCGGLHSASLLLHSVDFAQIRPLQIENRWDEAGEVLAGYAENLENAGAALIILATNTMHKVAPRIEAALSVPFLHIVDPTAHALHAQKIRKAGLLGTCYTMEEPFYKERLQSRFDIGSIIPDEVDRRIVDQVIFSELCVGKIREESRREFSRIIQTLADKGAEAIILGCTEIGLLVDTEQSVLPLLDTAVLHAHAAARMSVA